MATGELVGRFAVVVVIPLAAGLAVRAVIPRLEGAERELAGLAAVTFVVLLYAAMSAAGEAGRLMEASLASLLFLAVSAVPVAAWLTIAPSELRATGAFVIELRDFAVAAVLAAQAFGPPAATVAGIYGVLMLLVGAAAAQLLQRLGAGASRGSAPSVRG